MQYTPSRLMGVLLLKLSYVENLLSFLLKEKENEFSQDLIFRISKCTNSEPSFHFFS